jgi:two-component system, LuxR family, response regulator FixJ
MASQVMGSVVVMSRPADTSANLTQIKTASSTWCFFTSMLPIRSRATSRPMTQQNQLLSTGSSTGLIVTVIGGDLAVRHALKFWLELEGLTVRSYVSGAEFLEAGELTPCDCLIVDEKIPETSGLQLIADLRDRNFDAPAILVISQPSPSLRKEAEKAGVPIVEKPLLGNGLLDTIRDATRGR